MKLYVVVYPGGPSKLGTLYNRDDEGFEPWEWVKVPGEPRSFPRKRTGILIPHVILNPYVARINDPKQSRFVLENGHVYIKQEAVIITKF